MKYVFKDINNPDIYKECRVMFVAGPYNIFNNMVVDELKKKCVGSGAESIDTELMAEFGVDVDEQVKVSNTVDFDTFTKVFAMPSINGKWFTVANLANMTKKQNDWLKEYIKNPSENGIVVLTSTEYKHYKFWLSNRKIPSDKYVSIIQLSFPRKDDLKLLVTRMFQARNARIEERALELFIVRMSSEYDQYDQVIEKICVNNLPEGYMQMNFIDVPPITYQQAFESLRGIENFVIDDFMEKLAIPLPSDNPNGKAVVFKMMGYLVEEYGARKLVNTLTKKIDELIEFRLAINAGYIPIIVNYNVDEAKKLLGEESEIAKKSDYQFRRLAKLASRTSLQDWFYMRLILQNVNKFNEESYNKALYSLVTRSVLTESRINNNIGIDDLMYYDLNFIDAVPYLDIEQNEVVET